MLVVSVVVLGLMVWFDDDVSLPHLTAFFVVAGFFLSFGLGFDIGVGYRKSQKFNYTVKLNETDIKARLVRSGEKGLLFFEAPTNILRYVPWDDIKGISSNSALASPIRAISGLQQLPGTSTPSETRKLK